MQTCKHIIVFFKKKRLDKNKGKWGGRKKKGSQKKLQSVDNKMSKRKHPNQGAQVLYTPDLTKVKLDSVVDSNWCIPFSQNLEEGVSIEFKAGNAVSI